MASQKGFTGAKFYGSMSRDWLIPAAAEAKRLNLDIHGHVPAGRDLTRADYRASFGKWPFSLKGYTRQV
jgi:hypothetical protein